MEPPRPPWPRALAFAAAASWMVLAPCRKQLFGLKNNVLTLDWAMFRNVGQNACLVHYVRREGGAERTLDRFALLGHEAPAEAPAELRVPESAEEARAIGASLCEALGPKADVRLYARCPVEGSFVVASAGEANLCADGGRPP
ncbi:MAG TPA: hypothetical protein VFS00_14215 [Polyangiaceae bacterium]|nr:hypothetical protein [Polyangiaceae bacterium]